MTTEGRSKGKKSKDSVSVNDQGTRLKAGDASSYFKRGNAKIELGQYDKAIADYDEAIRLNPDDADAYNNRGNGMCQ